jgi:CheY-like chemotaxis protein
MSLPIIVPCPGCAARIKFPVQLLGQTRKCPGCNRAFVLQRPRLEDSGPLLVSPEEAAWSQPEESALTEKKVILLVDDDRELNDGLRIVLEDQGHLVIQAFDGAEARELVNRHRPDLMILDLTMPRISGYGVLQYLRTQPATTPVIMMTGNEGSQHRVNAEYLGVIDYLNKPFAIDRFLASVEQGLERKGGKPLAAAPRRA